MRIGINALLLKEQRTGTINYIYNLIKALDKLDRENEYILFTNRQFKNNGLLLKDNFCIKKVGPQKESAYKRIWWEQFHFSNELACSNVDIFHSPSQITAQNYSAKSILTVHDLSFLIYPKTFPKIKQAYYRHFIPSSIYKADKIIAVSENTKKDILRFFKVPAEKIEVVYYGLDEIYRPVDKDIAKNEIRQKLGIVDDYILYAGTIEPRKNLLRLIEAYTQLRKETKRYKLVIAGPKGWLYSDIYKAIEKLNLTNDLIFTGCLYSNDLLFLYNAASIFVYPSLYEGFGLPVLEAMACGIPVIASNTSALREVAQDAAILINPLETKDLLESIRTSLDNVTLAKELSAKGLNRAGQFSWEDSAEKTLRLYMQSADI